MHVKTEVIQQMRDGRVRDRRMLASAPESVKDANETMICLLNELLQFRDAEAAAEAEIEEFGLDCGESGASL